MKKHAEFSAILTMVSIFFLSACASTKKKELPTPYESHTPISSTPLVLAPIPPVSVPLENDIYPEKVPNPDQVVLILGPGMVQGYSCVGILKALHEMKVPIRSIYASEVCAWVSAAYLTQPTLNRMDWALMQVGEDSLFKAKTGLRIESVENRLEQKLKSIFGERQLEELNPPLSIPLKDKESGEIHLFQKGKIREVIRAALSTPNGLSPGKIDGRLYSSASLDSAYPFQTARKTEGYPIFLFEIEKMNPAFQPELISLGIDRVSVPVRHLPNHDYKKRNEAIYLGKKATQEAKAQIFERLGRTE